MPTQITLNQLLLIGTAAGVILGLIPLFLGISKKNLKYGLIGFVLTVIGGAFFSLLGALPISGVFIWLILRKQSGESTDNNLNENKAEDSTQDSENL